MQAVAVTRVAGTHRWLCAALLAAKPWAATAYEPTCPLGDSTQVSCDVQGWAILCLILLAVICVGCALRYRRPRRLPAAQEAEEFRSVPLPCDLWLPPPSLNDQYPLEEAPPRGCELPPCRQDAEEAAERVSELQPSPTAAAQDAVGVTEQISGLQPGGEAMAQATRPENEHSDPSPARAEDCSRPRSTKLRGSWDVEDGDGGTETSIDIALEVVQTADVDVGLLAKWQRTMSNSITASKPWRIGPRHQPHLFCHLASHVAALQKSDLFELALDSPCLYLKRLALDMPLLMDGVPLRQPAFVLWNRVEIGLCCAEGGAPQFTFRVSMESPARPAGNALPLCIRSWASKFQAAQPDR